MPRTPLDKPDQQPSYFEYVTRRLRWACSAVIFLTFPFGAPQKYVVYGLALGAAVYNCLRYVPLLLRWKPFASPVTIIAADLLFTLALVAAVGNISTPYSAYLVFIIISTAYLYGTRGILLVGGIQAVALYAMLVYHSFEPVMLNRYQMIGLLAYVLIALGILVEQMTRSDREQRNELERLSHENAAERAQLLALLNSIKEAIFVVDISGNILLYNKASLALTGRNDSLLSKPFAETLPLYPAAGDKAKAVDLFDDNSHEKLRRDLQFSAEHGAVYDLDITVTPVPGKDHEVDHYIVVCHDITKEHSLDEQRQEFISVASHELRTPLAIMEAGLSLVLLNKTSIPERTLALIEQAHRNVLYLGQIVKDLTLIAEAKNDHIPIELGKIDPAAVIEQVMTDFTALAAQKGLELRSSVAPHIPIVLSTERHIKEILQNYVNNALKYTKQGVITLSAEPSKSGGVLFSVKDTGIGISPSDQKRLFTKFFRAEDYRTRETGGTGLGLYLCMELANRLAAKVSCESTLNEGSTFYLDIPPLSPLKRDQGEVVKAQVANMVEGL